MPGTTAAADKVAVPERSEPFKFPANSASDSTRAEPVELDDEADDAAHGHERRVLLSMHDAMPLVGRTQMHAEHERTP